MFNVFPSVLSFLYIRGLTRGGCGGGGTGGKINDAYSYGLLIGDIMGDVGLSFHSGVYSRFQFEFSVNPDSIDTKKEQGYEKDTNCKYFISSGDGFARVEYMDAIQQLTVIEYSVQVQCRTHVRTAYQLYTKVEKLYCFYFLFNSWWTRACLSLMPITSLKLIESFLHSVNLMHLIELIEFVPCRIGPALVTRSWRRK